MLVNVEFLHVLQVNEQGVVKGGNDGVRLVEVKHSVVRLSIQLVFEVVQDHHFLGLVVVFRNALLVQEQNLLVLLLSIEFKSD